MVVTNIIHKLRVYIDGVGVLASVVFPVGEVAILVIVIKFRAGIGGVVVVMIQNVLR